MKAQLRKVPVEYGSSFGVKLHKPNDLFTESVWHFHSEYELIYLSNGKGQRHVGNHISNYENGELIFIGPRIPHYGYIQKQKFDPTKIVIQMKADFLGEDFLNNPELKSIKKLFKRSENGISFTGKIKHDIGKQMLYLERQKGFDRVMNLLSILNQLSLTEDYNLLNADSLVFEVMSQDVVRMELILKYINLHYKETISLEEISKEINMTVPSFCRFFKKLTHQTFTQFVNKFRILKACRLLQSKDRLITEVAMSVGFKNLSHFNKQFLLVTGMRPSDFKKDAKANLKLAFSSNRDVRLME